MRRNLVIVDGIVAKRFLEQASGIKSRDNEFLIVYQDESILPEIKPENFLYYNFDATSFSKLSPLVKDEVTDIYIILKNKADALVIYENIRKLKKKLRITMLDMWNIEAEDKFLQKINSTSLLSQKLIEKLPGIPVTPKDIGLGAGEITEVSIPFSSSYVYRFVGSIEQRNWKIVGIYRDGKLIIAKDHHVIQPNDSLLVIGDPNILKTVYNAIKEELGQFPNPFGANLYLYIDFEVMPKERIEKNITDIIYLNKTLKNKKLFLRVVNPNDFELLEKLRSLESRTTSVEINYTMTDITDIIPNDIKQFNVGSIVIDKTLFSGAQNKRLFYKSSLPILKLGDISLEESKTTTLILNDIYESEKISSVVFDISKQLDNNIELISFEILEEDKERAIEHYENLSKIFGKKISIVEFEEENPLLGLKREDGIFQVLPFNRDIVGKKISAFFSTDMESNYFILDRFNQLFIPITNIDTKVL